MMFHIRKLCMGMSLFALGVFAGVALMRPDNDKIYAWIWIALFLSNVFGLSDWMREAWAKKGDTNG